MSELPSEDQMTALAIKTMYAAKQEIPKGTKPDLSIEIGQRQTEITVETRSGKKWTKTFVTRRLNKKANENAEELFGEQVNQLLEQAKADDSKERKTGSSDESEKHSNIKRKV